MLIDDTSYILQVKRYIKHGNFLQSSKADGMLFMIVWHSNNFDGKLTRN